MRLSTKASLLRSSAIAAAIGLGAIGQTAPVQAATVNSLTFDQAGSNANRCVFTLSRSVTGVINDSNGSDDYFIAVVDTATGQPSVTGPVGRSVAVGQTDNVTESILSFANVPRGTFEVAVYERVGTQIGVQLASAPIPRADLLAAGNICASFAANSAPIANAGPDRTFNTTSASGVVIPVDAANSTDADNDPLTYSWTQVSGPQATISLANQVLASISFPTLTAPTDFEFQVLVTDAAGESSTDTVRISLTPPNIAPTVDAGPDQTVVGGSSVSLAGTASDADNDPLTFQWTQTGGPGVALTGDTTLGPTFTAPSRAVAAQVLTFELAANDGNATATDTVTITVPANQAPNADAGPAQTVAGGSGVTLDASASSDPEGDPIIFNWTQISGPSVTLAGANSANPTFTAPQRTSNAQVLEFEVRVTDSFDASDTATVQITIPANQLPLADAGPDQNIAGLSNVTLDGSGSTDFENDPITYIWTQTGGPNVTLNNPTSVNPTFTAPAGAIGAQVLTFQLTVSDSIANSGARVLPSSPQQDTVEITILPNNAPLADAGQPQTVDGGSPVTLDGSGSTDPDGDALSYAWVQTSGPSVTLSGPSTVAPSFTTPPRTNSAQTVTFELTVTDTSGASSTATVEITVPPNNAPLADAGQPQSVDGGSSATLDGSGSTDPDGDALSYAWVQTTGPSVTLSGANTVAPSFTAPPKTNSAQAMTFELTVTDTSGASSTATVEITILPNNAPLADAGQSQTVDGGSPVTLDGSGSTDPDGDALSYTWVQTSGPSVTLSGASTVAPSFTAPPKANSAQTLTFELTVTDASGASSTAAVEIAIAANQLPLADAGPDQSVTGNSGVTLDGSGSSDPDGDQLFYSWTQTGGPSVTLNNPTSVNPTFVAPTATSANQVLTFELTVTDDDGSGIPGGRVAPSNPQQDTVEITILANSPPVADAGTDQGPIDAGQTVTLDGSGSNDPDNDALSYTWTQVSGTPVTLTGVNSVAPTFVAPVVSGNEDLVFSLIVDDGQAQSAADTVVISVRAVGSVTIIQRAIGGDSSVTFASDIAALNGSVTTSGGSAQVSAVNVPAGAYSVSVNDNRAAGFAVTEISCNDTDSTINLGARSISLALSPGEDLVCTFTSTNSRGAAQAAIADFLTGRNALIMSHQPDLQRRLDRITGVPVQGGNATAYGVPVPGSGSLPFAVSLASGQAIASTSLAQISSVTDPQDRSDRPFDIWGEAYFSRAQLGDQKANFRIFHIGADYRVGDNVLLGVLAEFDDFDDRGTLDAGEAEGSGYLVGPYLMARIAPDLFGELRAAWGSSENRVNPLGSFTDDFDTSRSYFSGSLVGQFDVGNRTQLRPEVTLRYLDESQQTYTDSLGVVIPEQSVGQGDVSFRPRLQHLVVLESGWTLRPFIEAEGIYTFGTETNTVLQNGLRARVESGVDFLSASGVRASIGAFHDGIGADRFESTGVHVSISFGF